MPSDSSLSPGNCATSRCPQTALVHGTYFTRGWADSLEACEALVQRCAPPSPGWRYLARGTCDLGKCDPIPAGSYFTGDSVPCSYANCTNLPKSGYEYSPGFATEADGCPFVSCRVSFGSLPAGHYYSDGCRTSRCTNAPAGYYYLADGGDSDNCPIARCSNAEEGEVYVEGWATAADACNTRQCSESPEPGYRFASPGRSCNVTRCPVPPRGTYYTGQACRTRPCVNGDANPNTYYVHGYADDETSCPERDCSEPPPRGLYLQQVTHAGKNCQAQECTNANNREYYTGGSSVEDGCSVATCNRPPPGITLSGLFATSADCRTTACHADDLPTGFFWLPNCLFRSCDNPPAGYYYLRAEIFSKDECKSLLAKCTNAGRGQIYEQPEDLVLRASECPVKACDPPVAGRYHGFEARCQTLPCTGAEIGQKYVSSRESNEQCPVAACSSIGTGSYYVSPGTCAVAPCYRPAGYTFDQAGTCTHLNPCKSAPMGTYYTQSSTPCSFARCTGNNHLIPGFWTSAEECPRCQATERCPTTTTTTTTSPIPTSPSVTQQATSKSAQVASDDASIMSGPLIGGIAGGGALLLVVLIAGIIVCVVLKSKSNAKLVSVPATSGADSTKVTTIATTSEKPAFELPLSQRLHLMLLSAEDFMLVRDAISADSVADLSAVVSRVGLCGAERPYCDACPRGLSGGSRSDGFPTLLDHAREVGASQCENFFKTQTTVSEVKRVEVRVDMPDSPGPGATAQIVDQYRVFDVVLPEISPGSVAVCSVVDEAEVSWHHHSPNSNACLTTVNFLSCVTWFITSQFPREYLSMNECVRVGELGASRRRSWSR